MTKTVAKSVLTKSVRKISFSKALYPFQHPTGNLDSSAAFGRVLLPPFELAPPQSHYVPIALAALTQQSAGAYSQRRLTPTGFASYFGRCRITVSAGVGIITKVTEARVGQGCMKFLLVEDDRSLASAIESLLTEHRYVMDLATDGAMGQDMAKTFPYDLILLDWILPKLDGIQLCKHLRNEGNYTPIILMTAKDSSTDKVAGLDAGADDYLVKPFEFEELLARIRALLRRAEGIASPLLQWGDLCLDPRNSEVTCRSLPIAVTPKEYALLELFLRNPSRIFSLDNLLDKVWAFDDAPNVGSVRTHIKGLRQKLKNAGLPDMIATVYGLGYRLKSAEFAAPSDAAIAQSSSFSQASEETTSVQTTATASPNSSAKLDVAALWQGVSKDYIRRVSLLANILRGLQPGVVEKAEQQQILSEAHSLAGSLGSFGFKNVTLTCREIEEILRSNAYLSDRHTRQLELLITQVQQVLENGYAASSASPAPTVAPVAQENALSLSDAAVVENTLPNIVLGTAIAAADLPPGQLFQLLLIDARVDKLETTFDQREEDWQQSVINAAARYQMRVTVAENVEAARSAILAEKVARRPQIVVFDFDGSVSLPDNNSPEFALLSELQAVQPPIPALVLTAAVNFENRVRVARLGVAGLLQMPVAPAEVLAAAAQVLQKGAPPEAKLLIVDDDPAMLTLLQSLLQPWGFRVQTLSEPQHFWQVLERFVPDLVLLDVKMPEISGFDLCRVLRNAPRWQEMPVLFMSGYADAGTIQQVFSVGADDYIRKPIVAPELIARVLSWLERSRQRQLMANVDSLTGVANRRESTQLLTQMLGLARRQGQTLCFALIDFDRFKQVNDEYGHLVGDRVLRRFGESLRATFRAEDVVGRWGGEEFAIGLYGMSRQEGTQRLQQFLELWQQEQFSASDGGAEYASTASEKPAFQITFTAGVAIYPHDGADLQTLYRAADKALYAAKAAGRNQILSNTLS